VQRSAPCPVLTVKPKARPDSSDIDPPCSDCHAARLETSGARLWCDIHANIAHSFLPASEPPPYNGWSPSDSTEQGRSNGGP
jgi:hypothetical protein